MILEESCSVVKTNRYRSLRANSLESNREIQLNLVPNNKMIERKELNQLVDVVAFKLRGERYRVLSASYFFRSDDILQIKARE